MVIGRVKFTLVSFVVVDDDDEEDDDDDDDDEEKKFSCIVRQAGGVYGYIRIMVPTFPLCRTETFFFFEQMTFR